MKIIAQNKKAHLTYEFDETFEAGLVLNGAEIKGIRNHRVNLDGTYARIQGNEAWVLNMRFGRSGLSTSACSQSLANPPNYIQIPPTYVEAPQPSSLHSPPLSDPISPRSNRLSHPLYLNPSNPI